ncbi:MAG: hypothetical protein LBH50_02855 [Spirochaetaceae bacterium]|jgi:hypothetical protein|nr:hypothetical protein [Spirochaetaceae bacterium]
MNLDDLANWIGMANRACTLLGYLPKAVDKIQDFVTKNGFEIKTNAEEINRLNEYLKSNKKSKDEMKRCKAILKRYNFPKNVGIICKSDEDICFTPNKAIVDKTLNNLNLKSDDGRSKLAIGGVFFCTY